MVAVPFAEKDPAVAVKLALDEPAGTLIAVGTGNATLLLDRVTEAPPLCAAPDRVTVQEVACPEPRLVGLHVRLVKVGVATN